MTLKRMRIAAALLLCLTMVLGALPSAVFAAEAKDEFQVSKSKTASETELDPEQKQTEITLSLPSGEYLNKIDIVFAMDSSTSTESGTAFTECAENLFASILENNPSVELKVGVVRFRGKAYDAIDYLSNHAEQGMVVYSEDTESVISKALSMTENEVKAAFGNGSSTHAGLVLANEWLEDDTEVPDENKYVILLTDGKSYIWYNIENEPTTIYSQWYRNNKYLIQPRGKNDVEIATSGTPQLNQSAGYNKYSYYVDVLSNTGENIFAFSSFEDLFNSTDHELTGETVWDQPCYYADDKNKVPTGTVTKHEVTNGAELFGSGTAIYGSRADYQYWWEFTPDDDWKDVPYLEANPFPVIKNSDGSYTFNTEKVNPNYYQYHVDALQKGCYIAAHYWADMVDTYNCAAVTFLDGTDSAITNVAIPFNSWLRENSDYGAQANDANQIEAMFDDIDNDIRYVVGNGVVTDVIASEFDLVADGYGEGLPFKLTVGGEEIQAAAGDADNSWNFSVDNTVLYSVSYDESSRTISWEINVPVENLNPVALSYVLEWNDSYQWEEGKAHLAEDVDTNASAVLDYWRSVTLEPDPEKPDGTEEFESPKITYKEVTVSYDANADDAQGEVADENNPYKAGKKITVMDNDFTRENYVFKEWNLDAGGDGESFDEGDDYTLDEDTVFYAIWDRLFKLVYTWTGDIPDGKDLPEDENTYPGADAAKAAVDTNYTSSTKVKSGNKTYSFSGWDEGTVDEEAGTVTFAGEWTSKPNGGPSVTRYTLTYVSNGGTEYAQENYAEGVKVTLDKSPKKEGFTFTGWYADAGLTEKIESVVMDSDKTVYAGWGTAVPIILNDDDHFAYIVGYPDGTVMPDAQIKRSEVATVFFRLLDEEVREQNLSTVNNFNDVDDTMWFNTAVSTLAKLGIIDGYSDGGFHPESTITRAEFAAIAARFDSRKAVKEADFSDISGHWASDEISRAAENGWIDGYTDGSFKPDAKIKRCEAMAIINRVLNRLPSDKEDLLEDMVTWPDNMDETKWYYLHVQEATNSHDCEHRADGSEFWTVLTEVPDWERYER